MPRKKKPRPRSTCDFTIRNSFHNTSYTMRTRWYKKLTRDQIGKCRRNLCVVRGCTCGGILGQYGEQDYAILVGFDLEGKQVVTLEPLRGKIAAR